MIKSGSTKKLWDHYISWNLTLGHTLHMILICCMVKCQKPSCLVKLQIFAGFVSSSGMSGSSYDVVLYSSLMTALICEDIPAQVLMLDQHLLQIL